MMCKTNWTSIINLIIQLLIAVGTIAVAVIAIWLDWIRYYIFPPKLKIELHNIKGDLGKNEKVIYYHLKVVNKRNWVIAKNCRVLLKEIHKELPNGELHKKPMTVDSCFFWSPRRETPLFMDVSDEQAFDFIIAKENPPSVDLLLNFYPQNFDGNIESSNKIVYGLEIKAERFRSKRIQLFEVAWNGKWTDNLEIMSQNLTIRELKGK